MTSAETEDASAFRGTRKVPKCLAGLAEQVRCSSNAWFASQRLRVVRMSAVACRQGSSARLTGGSNARAEKLNTHTKNYPDWNGGARSGALAVVCTSHFPEAVLRHPTI